jgi:glycerate kinase
MADGGQGFVDVLHAALGGTVLAVTVSGPHGTPVPATLLVVGDTAYVESAQACGPHLLDGPVETATSRGVGELVAAAVDAGVTRLVVGLGGSGAMDGGAGFLAALGATGPLGGGAAGLAELGAVDLTPARDLLAGVALVAATDTDHPLTGLFGAPKTAGPQVGLAEDRVPAVDGWLEAWAVATDRRTSLEKGAGAAGGLGFGLLLLGAARAPGIGLVAEAVDLAGRARTADALGIESAYSVVDLVGEERAFADPAGALAQLAERVARTWSR